MATPSRTPRSPAERPVTGAGRRRLWLPFLAAGVLVLVGAWLRLGTLDRPATLIPDEAYSALVADHPLGTLTGYVRATDPHPPLYYLVLKPFLGISSDEALLRLPSALCSLAALVVLAVWRRRDRAELVLVTAVAALQPFALYYGRQARMYGQLQLLGVVAAVAAERWVATERSRRWTAIAALAGTAVAFSHTTGPLVLAGLATVPGLRRDRAAWEWRAAMAAGAGLFVAAWGATLWGWRGGNLYEPVTATSFSISVNEMVAALPDDRIVVLPLLAAGTAVALWGRRVRWAADPLSRAVLSMFVVPVALAAIVSLRVPVFIPKTLVVYGWAIPVVFAALVRGAARRHVALGAGAALLVAVAIVPAVGPTLAATDGESLVTHLSAVVAEGDVVAAHPLTNDVDWYVFHAARARPAPDVGLPDSPAVRWGDPPYSGRVWLVEWPAVRAPLAGPWPPCGPPPAVLGGQTVRCVQIPAR